MPRKGRLRTRMRSPELMLSPRCLTAGGTGELGIATVKHKRFKGRAARTRSCREPMTAAGKVTLGAAKQGHLGSGGGKGPAGPTNPALFVTQHSHHVLHAELTAGGFATQQLGSALVPRVGRFQVSWEKQEGVEYWCVLTIMNLLHNNRLFTIHRSCACLSAVLQSRKYLFRLRLRLHGAAIRICGSSSCSGSSSE
jgi:hypothetical protein